MFVGGWIGRVLETKYRLVELKKGERQRINGRCWGYKIVKVSIYDLYEFDA